MRLFRLSVQLEDVEAIVDSMTELSFCQNSPTEPTSHSLFTFTPYFWARLFFLFRCSKLPTTNHISHGVLQLSVRRHSPRISMHSTHEIESLHNSVIEKRQEFEYCLRATDKRVPCEAEYPAQIGGCPTPAASYMILQGF